MKKLLVLSIITIVAFISGCQSDSPSNETSSKPALQILKWGPTEAKKGEIPNKQPDEKMGIWIDVSSTEGLGDLEVIFEGRPQNTAVQPKLITAGVSREEISVVGDKKVEIKQLSTGKVFPVGTFRVLP